MAKSLLEESSPSEAEKYIENTNIVKNPDSTEKAKAFAQGVLDLLKPVEQGGNMSMNDYSNMMQEVDKKMVKKEKRVQRKGGGSMLNPPERETYQLGSVVKVLTKGGKALIKRVAEGLDVAKKEIRVVTKEAQKRSNRSADEGVPYILDEGEVEDIVAMQRELGDLELRGIAGEGTLVDPDRMETVLIEEFGYTRRDLNEIGASVRTQRDYLDELAERIAEEGAKDKWGGLDPSEAAFEYSIEGMSEKQLKEMDEVGDELEIILPPPGWVPGGREPRQAGGSMLVPPEMEDTAAPVDTYPNIPPEEMAEAEASQLPDEEMEGDYVDFVMSEALDQEEQTYLMNALEADPQLSMIFDKVVDTASEFSGAGEVTGPGTGVSDSIPARLSDGEFVVTKKATDQIGADNLQTMMDEAERAFDGGLMEKDEVIEDEDIKKSMISANQMPSLNVRQR